MAYLFYSLELTSVEVCSCSAAVQLLSMGLFPASPLRSTLAVDLNVLDFVNELFVRSPPNTTAWCDSLEAFLGSRSYKLESRDAMWRRFGNALQWYGNLVAQKELLISGVINESRLENQSHSATLSDTYDSDGEVQNHEPPPSSSPSFATDYDSEQGHESQEPRSSKPETPPRPSEYLRQRCPLCFGGDEPHNSTFL